MGEEAGPHEKDGPASAKGMEKSVEEQYAEHKVENDQQNKDTIHSQVNPHIRFILPVKILQSFEHLRACFSRKLALFAMAVRTHQPDKRVL